MAANDAQVGGNHYKLQPVQHWDYVVAQGWGYGYLAGQITKYVSRAPNKNGLEDLKKASHFLDKLIEEVEAGRIRHRNVAFGTVEAHGRVRRARRQRTRWPMRPQRISVIAGNGRSLVSGLQVGESPSLGPGRYE